MGKFMSKRKDFKPWAVEVVYNLQEGSCAKCGSPLSLGYHKHHKDGNPTNNSIENLELLCPRCHNAEKYSTMIEQKKQHIGEIQCLIKNAIEGKLAGTVLDKLVDAIKLSLTLEKQVYAEDLEEPPVMVRAEYNQYVLEWNLKSWIDGFKEGLKLGVQLSSPKGEKGEDCCCKEKGKSCCCMEKGEGCCCKHEGEEKRE